MEYSQVERRRFLVPRYKGSNPFTPTDDDVHTIYMLRTITTRCGLTASDRPRRDAPQGRGGGGRSVPEVAPGSAEQQAQVVHGRERADDR